jgi:hypothetical protein
MAAPNAGMVTFAIVADRHNWGAFFGLLSDYQ